MGVALVRLAAPDRMLLAEDIMCLLGRAGTPLEPLRPVA
jgi:hypothetical protein